jgi:hypothetical protein
MALAMPYLTRASCDMVSVSRLRVFRMLWESGECRVLFRALRAARGVGNLEGGRAMCRGEGRKGGRVVEGEWWRGRRLATRDCFSSFKYPRHCREGGWDSIEGASERASERAREEEK